MGVHVSPSVVIPKKGEPNKWRLILDLSAPTGGSVNDGISKEECSLQYTSVSEVVAKCVQLGAGTLMGKMDIQQAYWNFLVAPEDRHLLGIKWQGKSVHRQSATIRAEVGPINFLRSSRCPAVDHDSAWSIMGSPLPGRFPHARSWWTSGMW